VTIKHKGEIRKEVITMEKDASGIWIGTIWVCTTCEQPTRNLPRKWRFDQIMRPLLMTTNLNESMSKDLIIIKF